jgi:hypothetical protein
MDDRQNLNLHSINATLLILTGGLFMLLGRDGEIDTNAWEWWGLVILIIGGLGKIAVNVARFSDWFHGDIVPWFRGTPQRGESPPQSPPPFRG